LTLLVAELQKQQAQQELAAEAQRQQGVLLQDAVVALPVWVQERPARAASLRLP
jgi:hypothetical protein